MNRKLVAILVLLFSLAACAPAPTSAPTAVVAPTLLPTGAPTTAAASFPLTLTDSANRKVTITKPPQKVISLAPSATEMMFALGQGAKLVARDDFSDFPAEAQALPKVGGMTLNFEQIVALSPDLVLASGITAPDTIKKLEDLKLTVAVIGSARATMDSVLSDIRLLGQALGTPDPARRLSDAMQQKLDALKAKAANVKSKPKVYWELDATDPGKPYTVGGANFIDDIITLAAGQNVFGSVTSPFPQVSAEQVAAADPAAIILSDAAYGIAPDSVKARTGWDGSAAVK